MYKKPAIQSLKEGAFENSGVQVDCLRLDQIHPVVSGNKLFKLRYHLEEAKRQSRPGVVSFGGPYSNHLVALAFACAEQNLQSVGIIRGEEPRERSASLRQMEQLGMHLVFTDRQSYRVGNVPAEFEHLFVVPEGGGGTAGIAGAAEILANVPQHYTDIVCAVGTGTTLAGLVNSSQQHQRVTGICCLKISKPTDNDLEKYIGQHTTRMNWSVLYDYHFGGYAKHNAELLSFMNTLYHTQNIPTDFVYTGKLFYALYDLIASRYFGTNAEILVIHSGGLQGNRSLPPGLLHYNS